MDLPKRLQISLSSLLDKLIILIEKKKVVVIGAGIAGLTSAAILSKLGLSVTLIEAHNQSGGCAGTFKRNGYIFDVGATQVAGLESDGIHAKIFKFLEIEIPEATLLDPSCIVDLNDGSRPINIWYEKSKWISERESQFPGSQKFWELCNLIHKSNWKFANNDPVIPIRNFWDFSQFINALNPQNLLTGFLLKSSMFDLLKICGSDKDQRLIKFLNLQLKLYSQENVYKTAALYGCTVLQMSQRPHGLWHLKDSMQALSSALEESLKRTNAKILFNQKVNSLEYNSQNKVWKINALKGDKVNEYYSQDVIYTPPPQGLLKIFANKKDNYLKYQNRLKDLPEPSGALVFYSALRREDMMNLSANHYQFVSKEFGSLFISLSEEGDGRAPSGEITLIASIFTKTQEWFDLEKDQYIFRKNQYLNKISTLIEEKFNISPDAWLHRELSTPRAFERWTNRPRGIVGGLGQNPEIFGLFGLSSRTPFDGLWLCGDSIYPGEGTAGVSQSAIMVSKQILATKGVKDFTL